MYKELIETFPLYRGKLCVINTNSNGLLLRKHDLELKDKELYASTIDGCIKINNSNYYCTYIILNTNNSFTPITHGVIAHEAFHASNFLLSRRGVIIDRDNDEAQAYLIDWITDQIHRLIKIK